MLFIIFINLIICISFFSKGIQTFFLNMNDIFRKKSKKKNSNLINIDDLSKKKLWYKYNNNEIFSIHIKIIKIEKKIVVINKENEKELSINNNIIRFNIPYNPKKKQKQIKLLLIIIYWIQVRIIILVILRLK